MNGLAFSGFKLTLIQGCQKDLKISKSAKYISTKMLPTVYDYIVAYVTL